MIFVMHFLGGTMLTLYADAALQIKQFVQPWQTYHGRFTVKGKG